MKRTGWVLGAAIAACLAVGSARAENQKITTIGGGVPDPWRSPWALATVSPESGAPPTGAGLLCGLLGGAIVASRLARKD